MSTATEALAPTLDRLAASDSDYSRGVAAIIRDTLSGKPTGTLRAWMERHNGRQVTTLQVHNGNGTAWAPTGRTIDATRAGSVILSGSTRDYKGMRVIAASADCIIVRDDWHTVAYVVEVNA